MIMQARAQMCFYDSEQLVMMMMMMMMMMPCASKMQGRKKRQCFLSAVKEIVKSDDSLVLSKLQAQDDHQTSDRNSTASKPVFSSLFPASWPGELFHSNSKGFPLPEGC